MVEEKKSGIPRWVGRERNLKEVRERVRGWERRNKIKSKI